MRIVEELNQIIGIFFRNVNFGGSEGRSVLFLNQLTHQVHPG
ncbi:MAG: hypothetical protein ACI85Q_002934 [Salibacteraceae bacterium]|jgi:hypothetical protein